MNHKVIFHSFGFCLILFILSSILSHSELWVAAQIFLAGGLLTLNPRKDSPCSCAMDEWRQSNEFMENWSNRTLVDYGILVCRKQVAVPHFADCTSYYELFHSLKGLLFLIEYTCWRRELTVYVMWACESPRTHNCCLLYNRSGRRHVEKVAVKSAYLRTYVIICGMVSTRVTLAGSRKTPT
jgi:hypothetical protein